MSRLMSLFMASSAVWAGSVGAAYAAEAAAEAPVSGDGSEQGPREDIIVTGTLIRGVAPAGMETITVTQEDIKEAGGITTSEVLAKIPQISFFNRQPAAGNDAGVGQRQTVNQPLIHGLPTLILLDGRRISSAGPGTGGTATSIDPSIIPTGVLGGIEVVPDGGSALYGSDAVGGVINFTTIKRFDGLKLDGNVGFADDYTSYRLNATAGKDWGTGSIYISYSFNKANGLLGSARPYLEQTPKITTCFPANVANGAVAASGGNPALPAASYTYTGAGPDGKPIAYIAGPAACNRYTTESVLPAQRTHSVFAGLSQDLSSAIHVDLRAFYSTRRTVSYNAFALVSTVNNLSKRNPFYTPTPAEVLTPTRTQNVGLSLAPAVGPNLPTSTWLDTWGVSSEFAADVGGGFQVRLLGNYNQSNYKALGYEGPDTTLLAAALARTDPATALDPYNAAATPGSILVAQQIANRPTTNRGRTQQTQVRLVTDGSLFHISGGDVKIAAGGEMVHENYASGSRTVNYLGALTTPAQSLMASRTVLSAFGELEVPVISPESGGPIHELRLSAAARYDHYSDFGDTFNPRFAASLSPVEWLTFRGTYGKSFVAPALPQLFAPQISQVSNNAFVLPQGATSLLIVTGGNPRLQPQKATTWSLGLDLKVPFVEGLKASLTYYNVRFTNKLGNPPFTSKDLFYTPTYAPFYIQNPTYQQAIDFMGSASLPFSGLAGLPTFDSLYEAGTHARTINSPTYIVSGRTENIAAEKNQGLDFDASFTHPTSFGSVDFDVAGNYVLARDTAANSVNFTDALLTESRFRATVSLGANVDNFRFSATLFHTAGFGLPANATGQTRVDDYNTVDAFLSYTFKQQNYLQDTVLSLQVTNLFNVRPPVNLTKSAGYDTGDILGRTFQLGLSKKF